MIDDKKYIIPQYLDEPMRIILWTMDEFALLFIPIAISMYYFNNLFAGFIIGLVLVLGLIKLKGKKGHYFIRHLMYWHLPSFLFPFKKTPPSHIRFWIG